MLEICASMSPPEPIDEASDHDARVMKNPKTAIAILKFVDDFEIVSITDSD